MLIGNNSYKQRRQTTDDEKPKQFLQTSEENLRGTTFGTVGKSTDEMTSVIVGFGGFAAVLELTVYFSGRACCAVKERINFLIRANLFSEILGLVSSNV